MTFSAVPFLTLGIYRLFPRLEAWQTERIGFPFPVLVYLVMMAVPLLAAVVRRRPAADYGIAFGKPGYHLDIAATCFVPVLGESYPHIRELLHIPSLAKGTGIYQYQLDSSGGKRQRGV